MGLLPELNGDVTAEILLRVAPHDPACLVRASVVCKLWHRILSNPDFRCRYRSFHRGAPRLLGFFYNLDFPTLGTSSGFDFPSPFSRFIVVPPASPLPNAAATHDGDRRVSWALDCRHGRVLFQKADSLGLAVWDPIVDEWTDLPPPGIQYKSYCAVVLCDVARCDHSDCRGGRFLVVCIGSDVRQTVYACVYSSEEHAWQAPVSGRTISRFYMKRPTVIRDIIYCIYRGNVDKILEYNLVKRRFSVIDMPVLYKREPVLMQNEDGSPGFVGIRGSTLDLWSRSSNKRERGNERCPEWKHIKLKKVLRVDNKQCINANVIGFAEGVGVLFIRTKTGVFTLHLRSRRLMKVSNSSENYPSVVPFMSFFPAAGI